MNKNVTFEQVYWYLNDCPLRRLTDPVLPEVDYPHIYEKVVRPAMLDMYRGEKNGPEIYQEAVARLKEAALPSDHSNQVARSITIMLAYTSLMVASLRPAELVATELHYDYDGIEGYADVIRIKENRLTQMVWFRYDSNYPDAETRMKLYHYAQWNARLYELHSKQRPFQLTFFYPHLNEYISFMYNPESRLEAVAELIRMDVVPAKPGPRCDRCTVCPMRYSKIPILRGEFSAI